MKLHQRIAISLALGVAAIILVTGTANAGGSSGGSAVYVPTNVFAAQRGYVGPVEPPAVICEIPQPLDANLYGVVTQETSGRLDTLAAQADQAHQDDKTSLLKVDVGTFGPFIIVNAVFAARSTHLWGGYLISKWGVVGYQYGCATKVLLPRGKVELRFILPADYAVDSLYFFAHNPVLDGPLG